jgi:hypothetical protein
VSKGNPHCPDFTITLRHTAPGRTPLNEWSARHSELYLTTPNTHKRQTSTTPADPCFRLLGHWVRH